jgi:hypothetical protein
VRVSRILEDEGGRLPTQLEAAASQSFPADAGDTPAHRGASREGDLVHVGVADEMLARLTPADQHADHAGRKLGLGNDLGQEQRVERGFGSRFDDDGAAGQQGRRQLRDDDQLGHVPRRDRADHAHRLPSHDRTGIVAAAHHLPLE